MDSSLLGGREVWNQGELRKAGEGRGGEGRGGGAKSGNRALRSEQKVLNQGRWTVSKTG